MITGIARAGIDALIALAVEKTPRGRTFRLCDNPQVQDAVGRADAILNAGRVYRSAMIAELWNTIAAGGETTLEQRARCRLASTYAADSAREAMDLVYRHGGSTSFKRESRLAECWRDLHVVGQTVTVGPEWYPIGGRALLGMDPGRGCDRRQRPRLSHQGLAIGKCCQRGQCGDQASAIARRERFPQDKKSDQCGHAESHLRNGHDARLHRRARDLRP